MTNLPAGPTDRPPPAAARFISVRFSHYKALRSFSVHLRSFNVLVGPNNSGKSTILGAFRILSEGLRRAASRSPEPVRVDKKTAWGYRVPLEDLPISTENIFTNYDESEPARVTFALSNRNQLELVFPEIGSCVLLARARDHEVRSPSNFKRLFPVSIAFVPILGPVEHDEPLYQKEAARKALLTHRASRNFRNIWFHFQENFSEFRNLIQTTWPGMDIEPPKVLEPGRKPKLVMFCPESRYPREIFWSGFGFQVWCQLLTYAIRARQSSLLVIDEPDIYLHSDLQRQLLSFLQTLGPDILIATHSTEVVSEVDPAFLLVVNKRYRTAQHVRNPGQLQDLFGNLGSNLNPTLTQLAKTKRAVFVEGKDFIPLSLFARKLRKHAVANRSDFAIVPLEGFLPKKVVDMSAGFAAALGTPVAVAVVLDRDYRTEEEVRKIATDLRDHAAFVHIHKRKEIENFLLVPEALQRAVDKRIADHVARGGARPSEPPNVIAILDSLTEAMKSEILGQFIARRVQERKARQPELDFASLNAQAITEFEAAWQTREQRLAVVPGKRLFSALNADLQSRADVNITAALVISEMTQAEVPAEMCELIEELDGFRSAY